MGTDAVIIEEEITDQNSDDNRYHHHVRKSDRDLANITGYSGHLLTLCDQYKEPLSDPEDHPCCPDCAKRLSNGCRASR